MKLKLKLTTFFGKVLWLILLQDILNNVEWFLLGTKWNIFDGFMVQAICPARCKCDNDKLEAFCSNASHDLFPITMNPLMQRLFLDGNKIEVINEQISVYHDMELLDISRNKIKSVDDKALESCKNLKALFLSRNQLSRLTNHTFAGLVSLQLLDLSDNLLTTIRGPFFKHLYKLQTLDLAGNQLSFLSSNAFQGLAQLDTLILRNNLLSLSSSSSLPTQASLFSSSASPSSIAVSSPPLSNSKSQTNSRQNESGNNNGDPASSQQQESAAKYLRKALSPNHLRSLTKLDLSGNYLPIITKEESPFSVSTSLTSQLGPNKGLFNDTLSRKWYNLSEISLENCSLITLHPHSFNGVQKLSILRLGANKLQQVPQDALNTIKHLQELYIGSNPFTQINFTALNSMTELQTLDISHSLSLDSIHPRAFDRLSELQILRLSYNCKLQYLDGSLFNSLVNLKELILASNSLKTLDPAMASIGDRVTLLDVRDNPFTCNCSVQWIRRLFRRQIAIMYNDTSEPVENNETTNTPAGVALDREDSSYKSVRSAPSTNSWSTSHNNHKRAFVFVPKKAGVLQRRAYSLFANHTAPPPLASSHEVPINRYSQDLTVLVNSVRCADPVPLRNKSLVELDLDDIGCAQMDSMVGIVIGHLIGFLVLCGVIVICGIRWGGRLAGLIKGTSGKRKSHYPAKIGATVTNSRKIFGGVVNTIPTNNLDYGPYSKPVECIILPPGLGMETTTIINNLNNPYEVVPLRGTRVGSDSSSFDGEYHYITTTPITEL